jgi:glycosyltransferase involved in cell wall biosynthesis
MPTALVYRSTLLPYSETFIREQVLSYKNWRGVLVGRRLLQALPLDGLDVRLLASRQTDALSRARDKLRWVFGCPLGLEGLRRERPRLIHAHFGPDGLRAAPIAKRFNLPLAVTLHGFDINVNRNWWESGKGGMQWLRYPARLLRLSQRPNVMFVAVSNAIRDSAIGYGIPPRKIKTCYIGVDVRKFVPGPIPVSARGPNVLFVGRLVEKKGCEFLIRAMQIVRAKIPEAKLTVIGDGPLRAGLEALSRELEVPTGFLGALSSDAVRREFDKARVFCLPSVRAINGDAEGLPIVTLEAQACGVPVVTSANGGAAEGIEHGKSGFVVSEGQYHELAEKIEVCLRNDELAMDFASHGQRHVAARFDIRACTGELEKLYDAIREEQTRECA